MTKPRKSARSFSRAWPMVTLAFAAFLFGVLGIDWDRLEAQEKTKTKAKTKQPFETKKGKAPSAKRLPDAKSLTNGQKIDQVALTKLIDQEINKRLAAEKVKSSGLCTDEEFVRRVHLDLIGVIPTADRVKAFLADKSPDRRAKLVEELLANERFGKYLAETWAIMMVPRESNNRALQQKPLENWMADHFNKNTPLDKFVYEIVTAKGEIDKNPAGTYFVANPTVDKITDNVTRMFLGVQLQCAQCHNHPFTDWKQTEYWAMAAFFMKTRINGNPQQAAKKGIVLAVNEIAKAPNKKGALPESAKIVPPQFLQGAQPKIDTVEMRPTLAKWMTSADNRFFAKAMVNRFWYQLMGRGLVNPVDDMHDDNAATHPELLATLTEQFKLNGFDMKFLVKAICNSEVYQRSSATKDDAGSIDLDLYSRREIRVLMPEQLFDSLTTVLGTAAAKGDAKTKNKALKKGPQGPRDTFIAFFRVDEANPLEYQNGIPQALRMMNSPFTAKSDVTAAQITANTKTTAEALERIYLTALGRRPTAAETERLTTYVNRPGSTPRTAYGDILWALLNSSEFVLNH